MSETANTRMHEARQMLGNLHRYLSDPEYCEVVISPAYRDKVSKLALKAARKGLLDPVRESGLRLGSLGEGNYQGRAITVVTDYVLDERERHASNGIIPQCLFDSFVNFEILPSNRLPYEVLRYVNIMSSDVSRSAYERRRLNAHRSLLRHTGPFWPLALHEALGMVGQDAVNIVYKLVRHVAGQEAFSTEDYAQLGDVLRRRDASVKASAEAFGRILRNSRDELHARPFFAQQEAAIS